MLRLFYVCYYVAVGVSVPYFPPYLRALGLSGREVSLMMSLAPMLHLGAPFFWGWLADRTRRPDLLLRIACLGACAGLAPVAFVRTMPAMLLVYALHQAFGVAIGGLTDSLALERARRRGEDYGRIRLWGSLSFIAACWTMGPLLSARDRSDGDPLVPLVMTLGLGMAFLATLTLRGGAERERPHAQDLRLLLRDRRFLFLLAVAPLHWACAAPYHGFFAILIKDHGLPATTIGSAFALSVIGELCAFYFFRNLRRRFTLWALLLAAFVGSAVRWVLIAVTDSAAGLVALQALHTLTFGIFWGAALGWLSECVPSKLRATGQTLFTAATLGAGSIVGTMGAGFLYDATGGAAASFGAAAVLELVPIALTLTAGKAIAQRLPAPVMTSVGATPAAHEAPSSAAKPPAPRPSSPDLPGGA